MWPEGNWIELNSVGFDVARLLITRVPHFREVRWLYVGLSGFVCGVGWFLDSVDACVFRVWKGEGRIEWWGEECTGDLIIDKLQVEFEVCVMVWEFCDGLVSCVIGG